MIIVFRVDGKNYSIPTRRIIQKLAHDYCGGSYNKECREDRAIFYDESDVNLLSDVRSLGIDYLKGISNTWSNKRVFKYWKGLDLELFMESELTEGNKKDYRFFILDVQDR